MRAMILAAGLGTRLRPMTTVAPKPSLPVGNLPMLRYHLELLKAVGVTEVVINLHWLPEVLPTLLGDGSALGLHLTWSRETEILGTGGGIKQVADFLRAPGEPFFVLNGDLLIDVDLRDVLATHHKTGALATMVLREDPAMHKFGTLGVNAQGRIVDFVGRARWEGTEDSEGLITRKGLFTGIHVLEPEVLDLLPTGESCINQTAYPQLVREGQPVFAHFQQGFWSDVGTPERYLEANRAVLGEDLPWLNRLPYHLAAWGFDGARAYGDPSLIPGLDAARAAGAVQGRVVLGEGVQVGEGAILAGAVCVGAGAQVGAGALLRDCVVWPGAVVPAGTSLQDAIVWTDVMGGPNGQASIWRMP